MNLLLPPYHNPYLVQSRLPVAGWAGGMCIHDSTILIQELDIGGIRVAFIVCCAKDFRLVLLTWWTLQWMFQKNWGQNGCGKVVSYNSVVSCQLYKLLAWFHPKWKWKYQWTLVYIYCHYVIILSCFIEISIKWNKFSEKKDHTFTLVYYRGMVVMQNFINLF